jgi:broad specificity phosphatase PhoE
VALSKSGEQQARDLGARYVDQSFDAIFCSDLQRSYKTAQLAFGDKYPIIQDKRLRECNYGDMNRMSKDTVEVYKLQAITTSYPNGESYIDTSVRMRRFLQDLFKGYYGKKVMIIGHRATQYGLDKWIKEMSLKEAVLAPWKWQPGWEYKLISLVA